MRFQFCGDLDAPDWLLSNIAILSKLSSIQLKLLSVMIMKDLVGDDKLDYDKVMKRTDSLDGVAETKAAVASLIFIITNGARFNVTDQKLSFELQQLGLPKESCESLCRSYKDYKQKLENFQKSKTLQLPRLEKLKWRVDFVVSSSKMKEVNEPSVEVCLDINDTIANTGNSEQKKVEIFDISAQKFRVLYSELKAARHLMNEVAEL